MTSSTKVLAQAKDCGCSPARDETSSSRSPARTPAAPSTTSPSKSLRRAGRPLHVHHKQEETIHVLKGQLQDPDRRRDVPLEEGGFAYLPSGVPHAFLNLTDDPGEIVVVYTPGGGHKFYEELAPHAKRDTRPRGRRRRLREVRHDTPRAAAGAD